MWYTQPEQLRIELGRRLSPAHAVSFDIFDTLITRRISPPDTSKIGATQFLKAELRRRGQTHSVPGLLAIRDRVERDLRMESVRQGFDYECRLGDIVDRWVAESLSPGEDAAELAARVVDAELQTELNIIQAVPGMADVLGAVRGAGCPVLLISDMYLHHEHVLQLLRKCGYDGLFDELFVSSTPLLCKGSQRLYHHVRDARTLDSARWIHVGDNLGSDVRSPRRLGIRSYWMRDEAVISRREKGERLLALSAHEARWEGLRFLESCRPYCAPELEKNPYYVIGFWSIGPLLTSFTQSVCRRVVEEGIERLYFPAREGFVLQTLFERIRDLTDVPPEVTSEYAFLNRQTTFAASIRALDAHEMQLGFWDSLRTIRRFFGRCGVSPAGFEEIAKSYGLNSVDEHLLDPMNDRRVLQFFADPRVRGHVLGETNARRTILLEYLEQIRFFDADRVGIVDVGWGGTAQTALGRILQDEDRCPAVFGLYTAFDPARKFCRHPRFTYEGLMADCGRDAIGARATSLFRFVELLETATRAPHSSVVALTRGADGRTIEPVLRAPGNRAIAAEQTDWTSIRAIHAGIFDFVRAYRETSALHDLSEEAFQQAAVGVLNRLVRFPTREEAEALLRFSHAEDFGSDELIHSTQGARKLTLGGLFRKSRRSRVTVWPDGQVVSRGWPLASLATNLYRAMKCKVY